MLEISIRSNVKEISKKLTDFAYKQLPYAQAQAVTVLAKLVRDAEVAGLKETFPTATPFTLKSVGVKAARKNNPVSIIYVKDVAAAYLQPFETGGTHFLGKKKDCLFRLIRRSISMATCRAIRCRS